ncbi:MAG TPA: DUF2240 family protein [Methanomicrobiales archaeon]|nr:DUF2240 family protein [Methanomicrobiales archaeon]
MSLQVTVAAPFKHTRKEKLQRSEFIFYLTIDRKWMSRDQANQLLERAKAAGLVEVADGWVRPLLDLSAVTVPVGFRPDSGIFESEEASQVLVARIAASRGVPPAEVVAEVNRVIREGFDGNLRLPAAAVILARKYGVDFADLKDRLMVEVLKEKDGKDEKKKP